jgi:hypothetical protein
LLLLSEIRDPENPSSGGGSGIVTTDHPHCRTPCEHYSSKVSVKNTCPRKGELLFLGGDKTGAQLLQDTLEHGCLYARRKGPSTEERLDYIDFEISAVQCDIVRCCYLLQVIKCLLQHGGAL